jgi:hypothetical protein
MNRTSVCLAALVTALVGAGAAWGQYPALPSTMMSAGTGPGSAGPADATLTGSGAPGDGQPTLGGPPMVGPGLSRWIVGTCPDCCGPVGGNGPIQMEVYLQAGLDFPFSDGVFGHTLKTGWMIQGGGRTLFFNPEQDAAWVVDLSVSNVHNPGRNPSYEVPLTHILVPTATTSAFSTTPNFAIVDFVPLASLHRLQRQKGLPLSRNPVLLQAASATRGSTIAAEGVSIANLNRDFVTVGFGREWYLFGQAPTYLNCAERGCGGGLSWRVGVDGGGRYGSAKLNLHELRHRTDTIAGMYAAAHTDVEYPCGCCIFQAGIRVEYDYTWMDILQRNDADVQDINLLFTVGTRF